MLNDAGSLQAKWEEMFGEKKEEERSEMKEDVKVKKPRKKIVAPLGKLAADKNVMKRVVKKSRGKKMTRRKTSGK